MVDKAKDRIENATDDARREGAKAADRGKDKVNDRMPGDRDFQGTVQDSSESGGGMMDKAKDKAKDIAGGITDR